MIFGPCHKCGIRMRLRAPRYRVGNEVCEGCKPGRVLIPGGEMKPDSPSLFCVVFDADEGTDCYACGAGITPGCVSMAIQLKTDRFVVYHHCSERCAAATAELLSDNIDIEKTDDELAALSRLVQKYDPTDGGPE